MGGLACCGMDCADCGSYGTDCLGCAALSGAPPWVAMCGVAACPVYACCVEARGLPHCGSCPELPCECYDRFPSPLMTKQAHDDSVRQRAEVLRSLAGRA